MRTESAQADWKQQWSKREISTGSSLQLTRDEHALSPPRDLERVLKRETIRLSRKDHTVRVPTQLFRLWFLLEPGGPSIRMIRL